MALHDPTLANLNGVGAWVRITVDGVPQSRMVRAGGETFSSSGPIEVHFGLGEAERVEHIQVQWPDGGTTVLEDIEGRQRLVIER